jgi:hypothetical protein
MSSWLKDKEALQTFARSIDSSIILMSKEHWLWVVISYLLRFLMPREKFLNKFATTIGPLHGYPKGYSTEDVRRVIPHEGRHTQQVRACGLFIPYIGPWLGIIPMTILYVLLLPVGFNWFRYKFELDANVASWKYKVNNMGWSLDAIEVAAYRTAKIVGSRSYGWPLPQKRVIKGFLNSYDKLKREVEGYTLDEKYNII